MGATARAGVAVEFKATGVESVRNGLRLVRGEGQAAADGGEALGEQYSHAARNVAGAFAMISREGKVSGRELRELINEGSEMAVMFGGAGAIVGALGLLGVTIYNIFNRAREEIEATRKKAQEEMATLARSGDLIGLGKKAQELYSGDPYAPLEGKRQGESDDQLHAREMGVKGLENEIAAKNQLIATNTVLLEQLRTESDPKYAAQANASADALLEANNQARSAIEKLNHSLEEQNRLHQIAMGLVKARAKVEGEVAGNRLKEEQQKAFAEAFAMKNNLQPTLNNQFANDLFGVLLKPAKVHLIGELVLKDLLDGMNVAAQKGIANLQPAKLPVDTFAEKFLANIESMAERIRSGIADSIGNAIDAGFTAAFAKGANAGSIFASIAKSILTSMGEMFEEIGRNALVGLISMAGIKKALTEFMPEIGIPLAIGLIAFGAFLKGAAGGIGSGSSGGGGGSYGGSAYGGSLPSVVNTGGITAASGSVAAASRITPMRPQQNTIFVIGEDPKAWRQVQERLDQNAKRG